MLPEDAHHGEKLQNVILSQSMVHGKTNLTHLLVEVAAVRMTLSAVRSLGSCSQDLKLEDISVSGDVMHQTKQDQHFSLFFSEGSYMIVLCSRLLRSNIRTLPSAPQLTKTSTLLAQKRTSKTSLSCAISCVLAVRVGISHIVQVVSMLDVMMRLGESVFQSNEVSGAVCSGDLEFERRARGVSFCGGCCELLDERDIEFLGLYDDCDGRDHKRRWSPDVAKRSVDCFCEDAGSHSILVTGYECVASAVLTNSRPNWGASVE